MSDIPPPTTPPLVMASQIIRFVLTVIGAFVVYHWALAELAETFPIEPALVAVGAAVLTVIGLRLVEILLSWRNLRRWMEQAERSEKQPASES